MAESSYEACIADMLNTSHDDGIRLGLLQAARHTEVILPHDQFPLLAQDTHVAYLAAVNRFEEFVHPTVEAVRSFAEQADGCERLRVFLDPKAASTSGAGHQEDASANDAGGNQDAPLV